MLDILRNGGCFVQKVCNEFFRNIITESNHLEQNTRLTAICIL